MNASDAEEFTRELDAAVEPYLGRLEYGNIKKSVDWGTRIGSGYHWRLVYEPFMTSTSAVALIEENGNFSLPGGRTARRRQAAGYVRRTVSFPKSTIL